MIDLFVFLLPVLVLPWYLVQRPRFARIAARKAARGDLHGAEFYASLAPRPSPSAAAAPAAETAVATASLRPVVQRARRPRARPGLAEARRRRFGTDRQTAAAS